ECLLDVDVDVLAPGAFLPFQILLLRDRKRRGLFLVEWNESEGAMLKVQITVQVQNTFEKVAGFVCLPHGFRKTHRVAVFAEGVAADEARVDGADIVSGQELVGFQMRIALPQECAMLINYPQNRVIKIWPLADYNEIVNHSAECIYVRYYNTKIRKLHDAYQVPVHIPNSAVGTTSKGYQPTPSNHIPSSLEVKEALTHLHICLCIP
ncbi:50S ribosomal protein L1, partial [Striga asiatica]